MPVPTRRLRRVLSVAAATLTLISTVSAAPASAATPDPLLHFPQGLEATEFSSTWGAGRSGGRRHQGTDLMAAKMTPVYAAADGVITRIDEGSSAGRWITLDHGDGWETVYMHLNNDTPGTDDGRAPWSFTLYPGLAEGVRVLSGTLIGWVGDSGNAEWTGSHTHFELHRDGRAIDPYPHLVAALERAAGAQAPVPLRPQGRQDAPAGSVG